MRICGAHELRKAVTVGYYDKDEDHRGAEGGEGSARLRLRPALVVGILGVAGLAGGLWLLRAAQTTGTVATSLPGTFGQDTDSRIIVPVTSATAPVTSARPAVSTTAPSVILPASSSSSSSPSSSAVPDSTVAAPATADAVAASAVSTITTVGAADPAPSATVAISSAAGFPTAPDGTPVPVRVLVEPNTTTLGGYIPTEAARGIVTAFAVEHSAPAATIVDNLVVDATVPPTLGVRILDLTAARFPPASAGLQAQHATSLERVADSMNARPTLTLTVVGRTDDSAAVGASLADERARAVANFLQYAGISPVRVVARAADANDLAFVDESVRSASIGLTEFVFYGLFAG